MGRSDGPVASEPVGAERRKTPREELVVRVEYRTIDELFSDFASNINEGGIFIETRTPSPLGTRILLQFGLPGSDEPVSVHGTVVHLKGGADAEPSGMGIEFADLDARDRERIDALVRQLRSR